MADGFDIHIGSEQAERLRARANDVGMDVVDYALSIIDHAVSTDWEEERRRWAEYQRTGESVALEDALSSFSEAVERGLSTAR